MPIPSPLEPVKGAGTTLWLHKGEGDPTKDPFSDEGFTRLGKIKELQPGEISAESYDDSYLDDEDAEWEKSAQGAKSAGEASITLAWKPNEQGQKDVVSWFDSGDVRFYKIVYPNGAIDLFKGWVSNLGKTIPIKEVITRTIKVKNSGKPTLAEEMPEKPAGKSAPKPKD